MDHISYIGSDTILRLGLQLIYQMDDNLHNMANWPSTELNDIDGF